MNNYLEQYGRSISRYPQLYGGNVKEHYEKAKKNPAIRLIFVILVICLVLYLLYKLWLYLLKKQRREQKKCDGTEGCLFFDGVKNAANRITIDKEHADSIVPTSDYGVSTWLYVQASNFGRSKKKTQLPFSTVYAYAQENPQKRSTGVSDLQYRVQPGVWLSTEDNTLLIKWDSPARVAGSVECCNLTCNPANYNKRCTYQSKHYRCGPSSDHSKTGVLHLENEHSNSQNPSHNDKDDIDHSMSIPNIPIERWFHLVITVRGASIDVYVDGKLVKTRVLSARPSVLSKPTMLVSGTGHAHDYGFQGYITQHKYFNVGLSSYDVLSIYAKGPDPFHLLSPKQFVKKYL